MTYQTHIVARRGHMEDGEHVSDWVAATAVELETGIAADGDGGTDEEAVEAAKTNLSARIVAKREKEEEAKRRAAEDPMVRLRRLEAWARERGWDG